MADFVFNFAKGQLYTLINNVKTGSPANSRLKVIPIETSGIEADSTLKDYDDLAALLAGTSNEQSTMGRKTVVAGDLTLTLDDTNDRRDFDMADITWTAATGNAISALVVVYLPDGVTPGADSTAIPLTKHDFVVTPDGSDIVAQIAAAGFSRSA
jgi:predicted naringenin-chalcone synthase